MNPVQARKLTTLTIATVFGVGMAKSLIVDERFPPFKFFAACGVTAFLLSVAADIEPRVTGPFAVLILTVVMMEQGVDIMTELQNREFRAEFAEVHSRMRGKRR